MRSILSILSPAHGRIGLLFNGNVSVMTEPYNWSMKCHVHMRQCVICILYHLRTIAFCLPFAFTASLWKANREGLLDDLICYILFYLTRIVAVTIPKTNQIKNISRSSMLLSRMYLQQKSPQECVRRTTETILVFLTRYRTF